ncbi:hypothetical protein [Alicyclobacillus herbarius]|uniref:hypothetical protein n=1 Tax=Alicyclobacillus herbarius TaxID=122960 RepID=UPI000405C679|nr:hypothetical protein [Alicyclobacillus herbarius]
MTEDMLVKALVVGVPLAAGWVLRKALPIGRERCTPGWRVGFAAVAAGMAAVVMGAWLLPVRAATSTSVSTSAQNSSSSTVTSATTEIVGP